MARQARLVRPSPCPFLSNFYRSIDVAASMRSVAAKCDEVSGAVTPGAFLFPGQPIYLEISYRVVIEWHCPKASGGWKGGASLLKALLILP